MSDNKYLEFYERLKSLMERNNVSIKDVSDHTKINYEMVRRYANGLAKPREDKMKLLADFLNTTVAYLDYGETSTQLQTQNGQIQSQKPAFDLQAYIDSLPNGITHEQALAEGRESIFVDVYDISYCCGDGDPDVEYEPLKKKLPFDPSFFTKRHIKPENFKLIFAKGDSMADYINEGDAVGVDTSQRELKDGEVYALFLDGDNMIKRVFLEGGGRLRLSSINPKYKDKIIDPEFSDSLYIVGKVIYRSG